MREQIYALLTKLANIKTRIQRALNNQGIDGDIQFEDIPDYINAMVLGTDTSDTTANRADVVYPKKYYNSDGVLTTGRLSTIDGLDANTVAHPGVTYLFEAGVLKHDVNIKLSKNGTYTVVDTGASELGEYSEYRYLDTTAIPDMAMHTASPIVTQHSGYTEYRMTENTLVLVAITGVDTTSYNPVTTVGNVTNIKTYTGPSGYFSILSCATDSVITVADASGTVPYVAMFSADYLIV